jgi:hypothetical protein
MGPKTEGESNVDTASDCNGNGNGHVGAESGFHLDLIITDRDVVDELEGRKEEFDRNGYALAALKVGVLAIRQASGVIDARAIHEEGERLILSMRLALREHTEAVSGGVSTLLTKYFDPNGGELPQRIERLIRRDGELEGLLNRYVNGDGSTLSQTLDKHVGSTSPLLKLLSPDQQHGLLVSLREALFGVVRSHSQLLTGQFSLDDKDSALSRLVASITEKNGLLRKEMASDLATVRAEFSLDNKEGALSRLISQFNSANKKVLDEFSADNEESALVRMMALLKSTNASVGACLTLDDDASPLSRLRKEFLNVVNEVKKGNEEFQKEIRSIFDDMKGRRSVAARTTTHGLEFEAEVRLFVETEAQRLNDVFEPTMDEVGVLPRCKVGDCVLALGAETASPGSRIVFEAKDDKSYTSKGVRDDLQTARDNRQAQVGIFVWSKNSAPSITEPLSRQGCDITVIWDHENPQTDVYLKAAISLARLLVVRERGSSDQTTADLKAIDAAILTVTCDLSIFDEITKLAATVKNNGEKIGDNSAKLRRKIEEQLRILSEHVTALQRSETN